VCATKQRTRLLPNEFLKQHRGASRQRGRPTSFFGLLSSAPAATTTSVIRAGYVLSFRRGRKAASVSEAFAIISSLPERFQIQLSRRNFLPAIRVTIELTKAEQLPGYGTITYGQLKLMPYWDPLRGDPRFEKIVNSLAPK
jgi:hypothetical protein